MSFFVTGTDTGVGKTHTAVQVLRLLRKSGKSCAAFKPICCGDRQDAERLLAVSDSGLSLDQINPVWLKAPAAPLVAAELEDTEIDLAKIVGAFRALQKTVELVLVEGVGGWLVPIRMDSDRPYLVSDLAAELGLPVLIVALNRLGCLNHTALTEEGVRSRGLDCLGVVLNHIPRSDEVAVRTNAEVLKRTLKTPVLTGLSEKLDQFPSDWESVLRAI